MVNAVTTPSTAGVSAMQANIDAYRAGLSAGHSATDVDRAGVVLQEKKCLGYINLRVKDDDQAAFDAVKSVLGLALPALSQCVSDDKLTGLCYSPSEWLVITPSGEETAMIAALQTALAEHHSLVADVTGGTTMLTVSGAHAQDLLEKGTYVDLHDQAFAANQLYATQIAHAPATIVKNGSNDFSLIVRRSFANHIAEWALDGGREFGVCFS